LGKPGTPSQAPAWQSRRFRASGSSSKRFLDHSGLVSIFIERPASGIADGFARFALQDEHETETCPIWRCEPVKKVIATIERMMYKLFVNKVIRSKI